MGGTHWVGPLKEVLVFYHSEHARAECKTISWMKRLRVPSSQVTSSQVKPREIKVSQIESTQSKSTQVKSSHRSKPMGPKQVPKQEGLRVAGRKKGAGVGDRGQGWRRGGVAARKRGKGRGKG